MLGVARRLRLTRVAVRRKKSREIVSQLAVKRCADLFSIRDTILSQKLETLEFRADADITY
jgi:hypothetical protein